MKRRLLWGIGLPLGLVVAVALAVPLLVSGDALRDLVVESVMEATGADVELGEAEVRVLPRLSVRLDAGRIAGTGEALTAHSGTETEIVDYAAEIASIELHMALAPLFRREIRVTSVKVEAPNLTLTVPDDRIELAGAVLRVNDFELGVPGEQPAADAPPGARIPADLSCRADLSVARVTVGGAGYDRVRAEAALAERVVRITPIRAGRGGGALSGSVTLDYADDPWGRLTFEFEATGVPAEDLLDPFAPDIGTRLAADLTAAGRGSCRLQDSETANATLDLVGTVTAGEGVLHAGDWLGEVLPYLGERRDLVDVRITRLDHAFRVVDGRYLVDRLEIDGPDTDWRGGGWVGLDDAIDLDLSVKMPPGFTPDLGAMSFLAGTLRGEDGRVQLDLTLTGRSSAPKVKLNLGGLLGALQ